MASVLVDVGLFVLGACGIAGAVRAWRRELRPAVLLGHGLLAASFFAFPLATPSIQVPTDIAAQWLPWRDLHESVSPRNPLLADVTLQFLPFRSLVRERLLRGELPLWSHRLGTGEPLLANGQSAALAPLHLLALPVPPLRGMTLAAAWQVLLALLLMHALLRALGSGDAGAAFGAAAFAFSAYSVAWLYHPHTMAAAWIPGVLLGLVLLAREERGGFTGLVVCSTAMALSGHPETLAQTGLVAGGVAVVLIARRPRGRRLALGGRAATAALLAFGLAAPALLPLLEAIPWSERFADARLHPALVAPPAFQLDFLAPLVSPLVFGTPLDHDWSGPWNWNEICTPYAGALALAVALAGALSGSARARWLLAGGGAALLAAFELPPVADLLRALPGLAHATHARWRLWFVVAVTLAAGSSLEGLGSTARGRRMLLVCLAGVALGVGWLHPPTGSPAQLLWWLLVLTGLAASALALLWRRLAPCLPWFAVGAVVLDLFALGIRYHPVLPAEYALAPPPVLQAARPGAASGLRIAARGPNLFPNLAALAGLGDLRHNDPMQPAAAARLIGLALDPGRRPGQIALLHGAPDAVRLGALGVGFFLDEADAVLPPPWQRVFVGRGGSLWRNPRALSLFSLPATVRGAASPEAALRAGLAALSAPERTAVVEGLPAERSQRGQVRVEELRANGFLLAVDSPTGGTVASSVSFVPGWRVRGDGVDAEPLRVNGAFLGFRVPPGSRRVEVVYAPLGWRAGRLLGAGSLVAWAGVAGLQRWRRRDLPGLPADRPAGGDPA